MVIYNKYWPLLHDASYLLYDHWLGYNSGKQLSFNYEVETRGRLQVKKKTSGLYSYRVILKLLEFTSTDFRLSQHIYVNSAKNL